MTINPTQKRLQKQSSKKEMLQAEAEMVPLFSNGKTRDMSWWLATFTHGKWWRYWLEEVGRKWSQTSSEIIMLDIDRANQMVYCYDCLRKAIIWHKKEALHIFDIFFFNAHYLNCKFGVDQSYNLLKFRETIVTDLIRDSSK